MDAVEVPSIGVPAANLSTVIAAHLERLMTSGELPGGSRLPPERELAASLSVSRTSLREAMRELEQKRLIERTPGRGTIVLEPPDEVTQMRALASDASMQDYAAELRGLIEPQIAGLAAVRATDSNILALHDTLKRSHHTLAPAQSMALDVEFHQILAQATRNPLLAGLHSMVTDWTQELRLHSHANVTGRRNSVHGHADILAAVERHDEAAAQLAMVQHLAEVRELIATETKRSARS
jgi:GntR family transcriptional repressor for pyruvate dehydrogenase complex